MSWKKLRLGNVITLQRGHDLPESQRQAGIVPIISSSGITGYHNTPKACAPGVVTGRYGTLGEVFYTEEDYWPLNTALYVIDFKKNNPKFIAYFLRNCLKYYQSDKSAVPGINRNALHEMEVKFPEQSIQIRIVDMLLPYDNLIKNNSRRITLLEEEARQIYREWFVRLRFPGTNKTRINRCVLKNLCDDIRDSVLPENIETETPYIGLEHIPRRSITLCNWGTAEEVTSTKLRFKEGDIIFGKIRPYFHKVGFALLDGVSSSDSIVMRPVKDDFRYLVLLTTSSDEFVAHTSQTMREGSKMPRADWKIMREYPVLLPPDSLLRTFNTQIEPILQQLKNLAFQNRKLQAARDLLLPRLMSGEIPV